MTVQYGKSPTAIYSYMVLLGSFAVLLPVHMYLYAAEYEQSMIRGIPPSRSITVGWQLAWAVTALFILAEVIGYRVWQKQSLKKACYGKPVDLKEVSRAHFDAVSDIVQRVRGIFIGRVRLVVNQRTTETFVRGQGSQSWIAFSLSHLLAYRCDSPEFRTLVCHELAHIANGDHKAVGRVRISLAVSAIAYVLTLFWISVAALFPNSGATLRDTTTTFWEDFVFAVILGTVLYSYRQFLKQRELSADILVFAWLGEGGYVLAPERGHRRHLSRWKRILAWFTANHPSQLERARNLEVHSTGKQFRLMAVLLGFYTCVLGHWGLPLNPGTMSASEYDVLEIYYGYLPRILLIVSAGVIIGLDASRLVASRWRLIQGVTLALLRFVLGYFIGAILLSGRTVIMGEPGRLIGAVLGVMYLSLLIMFEVYIVAIVIVVIHFLPGSWRSLRLISPLYSE